MQRDLTLRTSNSEKSDNQSTRLVDSRGKRTANSKISIYSQKYTVVQNQTQRDETKITRTQNPPAHQFYTTAPLHPSIRTTMESAKKEDRSVHSAYANQQTPTALEPSGKDDNSTASSSTIGSLKDYLQSVRAHYQTKIKQIVEENARTMNELRNILMQQQHRIAEKEEIISRILNSRQFRSPPKIQRGHESPNKIVARFVNPNASQEYLSNKIKDLEKTIKIMMDHCAESEEKVKERIEAVEQGLIRHLSNKLAKCWFRITQFTQCIEKRCNDIDNLMANKQTEMKRSDQIMNKEFPLKKESLQIKMIEFQRSITDFARKQYRYENERVESLQSMLVEIMEKMDVLEKTNQLYSSRRTSKGYFFEDEDQFFYPSSERKVYEPNDDYEHFQAESQEDSPCPTKQNVRDNRLPTEKSRKH